jgi:hypothetical protein
VTTAGLARMNMILLGFLRTPDDEELTFAAMGNALPAGPESWTELEKLLQAVRLIE